MAKQGASLKSLGIQHGDMVFMHYPFERAVQPSVKRSAFESRPFGAGPSLVLHAPCYFAAFPESQQGRAPLALQMHAL